MPCIDLKDIRAKEQIPGYHAKMVHSATMTFVHWEIEEGAVLPEHSHSNEQVANIIEGTFELTIAGVTEVLSAGGVAIIPPNALHSGVALTHCKIIDAFYPVREDYLEIGYRS